MSTFIDSLRFIICKEVSRFFLSSGMFVHLELATPV